MTAAATISVALCTYNGERFLRQQLDSIFTQSVLPTELVISDDGSSDSTRAIIDQAIADHSTTAGDARVIVLQNPAPVGFVANFELAIEACSSEIIVLCDQDDVWHPERLERAADEFGRRPELLLLHSNAALIDAAGAVLPGSLFEALAVDEAMRQQEHDGKAWSILLRRNIVTGATTAFRRSLASIALPVPAGWIHDEWLAIVAAATGTIDVTSERLIGYRQHGQNQVGVQVLGVRGKFDRMLEAGSDRSARLLTRATSLVERLPALPGISAERVEDARAKLVHEQMRSRLGRHRIPRAVPVLRELASGRYGRFGRGFADAARDLLQPLDPGPSNETPEATNG